MPYEEEDTCGGMRVNGMESRMETRHMLKRRHAKEEVAACGGTGLHVEACTYVWRIHAI
jgi:hypothetical protein